MPKPAASREVQAPRTAPDPRKPAPWPTAGGVTADAASGPIEFVGALTSPVGPGTSLIVGVPYLAISASNSVARLAVALSASISTASRVMSALATPTSSPTSRGPVIQRRGIAARSAMRSKMAAQILRCLSCTNAKPVLAQYRLLVRDKRASQHGPASSARCSSGRKRAHTCHPDHAPSGRRGVAPTGRSRAAPSRVGSDSGSTPVMASAAREIGALSETRVHAQTRS